MREPSEGPRTSRSRLIAGAATWLVGAPAAIAYGIKHGTPDSDYHAVLIAIYLLGAALVVSARRGWGYRMVFLAAYSLLAYGSLVPFTALFFCTLKTCS